MRVRSERGVALVTVLIITMLVSALLVGVTALAMKQQQTRFQDHDRTDTFYAAQAGVEKLTNDLGRLFAVNYAPTNTQVQALATTPPTLSGGTTFVLPGGGTNSGYTIVQQAVRSGTVDAGKYAGLKGNITPYVVTATAKSSTGAEVSLQRIVDAVAIPVFQFGIFSDTDLSFFAGPQFNFGGKVHTNGDLYLAKGSGSDLVLQDRVTAYGDIIRTKLANGYPIGGVGGTGNQYTGGVYMTNASGGCGNTAASPYGTGSGATLTCRPVATNEGSLLGADTTTFDHSLSVNTAWAGTTGISLGSGGSNNYYNGWIKSGPKNGATRGTDVTRLDLPITSNGATPIALIQRPQVGEKTGAPSLYDQRYYRLASVRILMSDVAADITNLPDAPGTPVDLTTITNISIADSTQPGIHANDGEKMITGFILVSMQNQAGDAWSDVTSEFLTRGVSGASLAAAGSSCVPTSGTGGPIIRLQRVKDSGGASCTDGKNFWPNALFDPREALQRDTDPGVATVQLGGVMYYTELDIAALRTWLASKRVSSAIMETTGYVVYFSDRRGNHNTTAVATAPTVGNETGEYGYEDIVYNNGTLDTGEDFNGSTTLDMYGSLPRVALPACTSTCVRAPFDATANPLTSVTQTEARVNRPLLFRRALKIVNGSRTNMLIDDTTHTPAHLGLTIAAENPVYIQGDYNASMSDGAPTTPTASQWALDHVATAVIGDGVTLLSNNWNDRNSFTSPYGTGGRSGTDTVYRTAIVSGKGINFLRPTGVTTPDFGTDGGTHNFLRLLEAGGRTTYYKGSIVSLYYSRQATGTFKCCNTVYGAPTRNFSFDDDFTTMSLLPPRTPMFRTIDVTSFQRLTEPPTP
jgi:Tfp pilus assembly protein PilX